MFESILWGLIQGLTEFLPVSSSGHLRIVPELFGLDPPDLATSAVLHLGTLVAVVAYYRKDVAWLIRGARRDPKAQQVLLMVIIASIPAVIIGFLFRDQIGEIQQSTNAVAMALIVTGVVLLISDKVPRGTRTTTDVKARDAATIGIAQAMALLPGISRSGMAITASINRGLSDNEAARYSFLMAIPLIAGGGLIEALDMVGEASFGLDLVVGTVVAGFAGYWAISFLIKGLARWGLFPFAIYCLSLGGLVILVP